MEWTENAPSNAGSGVREPANQSRVSIRGRGLKETGAETEGEYRAAELDHFKY